MSLTTSMNNALSGLAAASRGAQVVSSNVANATTEGYGVRVLELTARANTGAGQGVMIDGVTRLVDQDLVSERWLAGASTGEADRRLAASQGLVDILGDPDAAGSLSQEVAAFEAALSLAIARPDSELRLGDVLSTAESLAATFSRMSDETQAMRVKSDANIAELVDQLNSTLENIDDLNALILRANARGDELPALLDERQRQIDSISDLIPIRQIERDNGAVALYTPSGTVLLDITPSRFEFEPVSTITPDMTLASGALSSLTLNGRELVGPDDLRAIAGGRIAAEFAIRDDEAPAFQGTLDALAAELIARFSDPAIDPTIATGDPGLFTDRGAAFDAATLDGLAARLSINAAVKPESGGMLWRLRDGIGATVEGEGGDATGLIALRDRLGESRAPVIAKAGQGPSGFPSMVDRLKSAVAGDLGAREQSAAFRSARFQTLDDALSARGVNTDQEMQKLLLIERFYAANAKVIEAVDEMLGLLTRL